MTVITSVERSHIYVNSICTTCVDEKYSINVGGLGELVPLKTDGNDEGVCDREA